MEQGLEHLTAMYLPWTERPDPCSFFQWMNASSTVPQFTHASQGSDVTLSPPTCPVSAWAMEPKQHTQLKEVRHKVPEVQISWDTSLREALSASWPVTHVPAGRNFSTSGILMRSTVAFPDMCSPKIHVGGDHLIFQLQNDRQTPAHPHQSNPKQMHASSVRISSRSPPES